MKFSKEYRARYGKKVWGFRGRIGGERVQVFAFNSREDAERAADDLRLQAIEEKYQITPKRAPVTLARVVEARIQTFDLKNRNHRWSKSVLERFRDRLPEDFNVTDLTTKHCRQYLASRRLDNPEISTRTVNQELLTLSACLHYAQETFPELERWRTPRLPYFPESKRGRDRIVADDEAARLLAALRAPRRCREQRLAEYNRRVAADVFQAALMTGARLNETRLLKKDQINFAEGYLVVYASKTSATLPTRIVPMTPTLRAILERRCAASAIEYVFASALGKNVISEFALRRAYRNAAATAKIAWGQKVGGITFHTTRHTATTTLLHAGADISTVMDVIGHSQATMTLRYGHATMESRKKAVAALEKFGNPGGSDNEAPPKSESAAAK